MRLKIEAEQSELCEVFVNGTRLLPHQPTTPGIPYICLKTACDLIEAAQTVHDQAYSYGDPDGEKLQAAIEEAKKAFCYE